MKYMDFLKGCSKKSLFLELEEITHYATDYTKNLVPVGSVSISLWRDCPCTPIMTCCWPLPPHPSWPWSQPTKPWPIASLSLLCIRLGSGCALLSRGIIAPALGHGRAALALTWLWPHRTCPHLAMDTPRSVVAAPVCAPHSIVATSKEEDESCSWSFFPFWTLDIFYDYMSPY
jgi:hypothetical protein